MRIIQTEHSTRLSGGTKESQISEPLVVIVPVSRGPSIQRGRSWVPPFHALVQGTPFSGRTAP